MATKETIVPKGYKGTDETFLLACERAGVSPTNRQFRRFNQQRGQAWAAYQEHLQAVAHTKAVNAANASLAGVA